MYIYIYIYDCIVRTIYMLVVKYTFREGSIAGALHTDSDGVVYIGRIFQNKTDCRFVRHNRKKLFGYGYSFRL